MIRLKPLKRLKGIPPIKRRRRDKADPIPGGEYVTEDEPHVNEIFIRLGRRSRDLRVAKRVAKLVEQFPNATIPELVTMDWLNQQNIEYKYLAQVLGGHARKGGVEADFLLQVGGVGMVWLINGNYWHSRPEVVASDVVDRLRFIGATRYGIRIEKVVALWERRIYEDRPTVFELALAGVEMGM